MASTPRALALGATIAFGSCQLAACDAADETAHIAPLATTTTPTREAQRDPPAAAEAVPLEPDLQSAHGRIADVAVGPGFTPDPSTWTGDEIGGRINAHELDDRCDGWIAAQPDIVLHTTRPFAELVIMAASEVDSTLVMVGPDGELRCGDNEDEQHPIVRGSLPRGTFRIWVGARDAGGSAPFVLAMSELDDSRPSSLLH